MKEMNKAVEKMLKRMIREALDIKALINPTAAPESTDQQFGDLKTIIDTLTADQEQDIKDLDNREQAKQKSLFTPQSADKEMERKRKEYTGTEIKSIQLQKKRKKSALGDLEAAKEKMNGLGKNANNSQNPEGVAPTKSTLGQLSSLFNN